MSRVNMFFADGYEEVEALTVVDLLRRVGISVDMISITGDIVVTGSHGISVTMDKLFEDASEADMIVLPGGMPGTTNLMSSDRLCDMIKDYYNSSRYIAAICAAPTVFGKLGLLKEKRATCYPGMEEELYCEESLEDAVVIDGKIITSRGLGTAIDFALAIIRVLVNDDTAENLAEKIVYCSDK